MKLGSWTTHSVLCGWSKDSDYVCGSCGTLSLTPQCFVVLIAECHNSHKHSRVLCLSMKSHNSHAANIDGFPIPKILTTTKTQSMLHPKSKQNHQGRAKGFFTISSLKAPITKNTFVIRKPGLNRPIKNGALD